MLAPHRYTSVDHLLETLQADVIGPAVRKQAEIAERRNRLRTA
jgi:hypothetical protein